MHSVANPQFVFDNPGVTTLFLFDYESVELPGADSIFRVIQACLERSDGVCALSDAGFLSVRSLTKFANRATQTRAVEGGVVATQHYQSITPSAAAMWTDRPENVELFHHYLHLHAVPRYQGAVLVSEAASYEDFLGLCTQWSSSAATMHHGVLNRTLRAGLGISEFLIGSWLNMSAKSGEVFRKRGVRYLWGGLATMGLFVCLALLIGRERNDVQAEKQTAGPERIVPARSVSSGEPSKVPVALSNNAPETDQGGDVPGKRAESALSNAVATGAGRAHDADTAIPGTQKTATATGKAVSETATAAKADTKTVAPQTGSVERDGAGAVAKKETAVKTVPVKSDRHAAAVPPDGSFGVQVGSFRNLEYAADMAKRLSRAGYAASVSAVKLSAGRTMHRVRVGSFATRKEAQRFGEKLKRREPSVRSFFVALNK